MARALAVGSLIVGALYLLPHHAFGQVADDFDAEIQTRARWLGDRTRWRTIRMDGNGWLSPAPTGSSDVLSLSTASRSDHGRWSLRVDYRTNLTHRYAARWYLTATSPDLRGPVRGYFLQIGGNNLDRIALYRQDGSEERTRLIAASEHGVTGGSAGALTVSVERAANGSWTGRADGRLLFSAADTTYRGGRYTGFWVWFRGEDRPAILFDELRVEGPVDGRRPDLRTARFEPATGRVRVGFDEPINPDRIGREAFRIGPPPGLPADVRAGDPPIRRVELLPAHPLRPGTYRVEAPGVTDLSGNRVPLGRAISFVVEGDTTAPRVRLVELLRAEPGAARVRLRAHPSEPIDPATVPGLTVRCRPEIELEDAALGADPVALVPRPLLITLRTSRLPVACRLGGLTDGTGNRLREEDHPIVRRPDPGELVLNELLVQTGPPEDPATAPEYLELYNRSGRALSLYGVSVSIDGELVVPPRSPAILASGGFWVLAAEPDAGPDPPATSRLARAFPGADLRPPGVLLTAVPRTRLGLRDEGATVRIRGESGSVLEGLTYGPDWHHSALLDPSGAALERIDPGAAADDSANWSTSPEGGTPGAPNALVAPSGEPSVSALEVAPRLFSPDGDGIDDVLRISGRFAGPVASVRIRIYDATGRLVRELVPADLPGPASRWTWDGRDEGGRALPVGPYVVVLDELDVRAGTSRRHRAVAVLARAR